MTFPPWANALIAMLMAAASGGAWAKEAPSPKEPTSRKAKDSAPAGKASHAVVKVGEAALNLPVLPGYAMASQDQMAGIARQIGEANRLLAFQIPRDVADAEGARREAALGRCFAVQTSRKDESRTISAEDFKTLKVNLRKSFAALQDGGTEAQAKPAQGKDAKGLPVLRPDRPTALQLFAGTDESLAIMVAVRQVSEVNGQRSEAPQAIASAMVLLKGKLVTLSVYSRLQSRADIEWVEKQTRAWIKDALAANR